MNGWIEGGGGWTLYVSGAVIAACLPINRPTAFGDWGWVAFGGLSGRCRSADECKTKIESICLYDIKS